MALPAQPDLETRERLLDALAVLVAAGGAGPLLAEPITPTPAAFPERWRATPIGVTLLLRRLAWHAGIDRAITIADDRLGAPPTERRPATRVELEAVRADALSFRLGYVGRDDVAGTLAHEIGVAYATIQRGRERDPYRDETRPGPPTPSLAVDDRDLELGSIATVYLGLGVLAANAAYQQYSGGRWNGGYVALEYDVLRAGYLPMSALAYLLAVQATVRDAAAPARLSPPQRDEVNAWIAALRADARELRARLGIAAAAAPATPTRAVVPFDDPGEPDVPAGPRIAFRWRTNRTGSGLLLGGAVGVALAMLTPTQSLVVPVAELAACVGAGVAAGRRARLARCSRCLAVVPSEAARSCCPRCNSALRGDIARLEERLDAEEALASTEDADRAS